MKKILLIILSIILVSAGAVAIFYINAATNVGALKVKTNVKAKVYLNDKFIGNAPLCKGDSNCEDKEPIKKGEYLLKIVPNDSSLVPFAAKITIHKDVLTYVERTFLPGSLAHAFIITLEKVPIKDPQLLVASLPSESLVFIDQTLMGNTPLHLKTIQAGEHELVIQKRDFSKRTLKIQTRPSYKLVVYVILGTEEEIVQGLDINPTSSPLTTATPSASVKITKTPTGFLNVRQEPTLSGNIVMKIYPGEVYTYVEESNGWYKIQLSDGTAGWISATYTQILKE